MKRYYSDKMQKKTEEEITAMNRKKIRKMEEKNNKALAKARRKCWRYENRIKKLRDKCQDLYLNVTNLESHAHYLTDCKRTIKG